MTNPLNPIRNPVTNCLCNGFKISSSHSCNSPVMSVLPASPFVTAAQIGPGGGVEINVVTHVDAS
jgi:hypothetical protein